jgi:hypothetical protein
MPSKRRKLSYFDLPSTQKGAPTGSNRVDDVAGGAIILLPAPRNVVLTTGTINANAAPMSYIMIDWDPPETNTLRRPDRYTIQVSTNTTFTASGTITAEVAPSDPDNPVARVDGLPPGVLHYVRLRGIMSGIPGVWTSMTPLTTGVNQITTAQDLAAASPPGSPAAVFTGLGDLRITWTNPTEANYKTTHIRVRASSGGTIYREWDSRAGVAIYSVAQNIADSGGDPSLYVELWSVTFSNVNSATVNTGLVTKAAPATPTGVSQSWSGDTGNAPADLTLTWAEAGDAAFHYVAINGLAVRRVNGTVYTYPYARNVLDNGGNGDPTLGYGVQAVDGLGQGSPTASGSATNAAPPTPTATLTQGAVGGLFATVTSTPPADLWRYEYVFKRDGTTVATVYSAGATTRYEMQDAADSGFHSWTVVIRVEDLFAQFSATVTPAAVLVEALTLSYLRDDLVYSDSIGTAAATLKSNLADDVFTSGGITYAA